MFFDGWQSILRVLVMVPICYIVLLLFLRVSGKRVLSKFNAYDFVITVALGSTLATVITSEDVKLAEGLLALALLVALQVLVSWLVSKHQKLEQTINGVPTLLVYRGRYLHESLRKMRITKGEIFAAARCKGIPVADAEVVVLETDGSISVVPGMAGSTHLEFLSDLEPHPKEMSDDTK